MVCVLQVPQSDAQALAVHGRSSAIVSTLFLKDCSEHNKIPLCECKTCGELRHNSAIWDKLSAYRPEGNRVPLVQKEGEKMKADYPCAVRRQVKDVFWRVLEVYNFLSAVL